MNKLELVFTFIAVASAVGCSVQSRSDAPATDARPQATTSTVAAPVKVPREFACNANAVLVETPLRTDPSLLLRPAGGACENHLLFGRGGQAHVLSLVPGMIVLADSASSAQRHVVCFSNERHSPVVGADPRLRHTDSVHVECASRTAAGWTPTVVAVPPMEDAAAWLRSVELDSTGTRARVRWMRDSKYQFVHTLETDRSPLDGIYETEVIVEGATLAVGATARLDLPMFERAIGRTTARR